jgi:hypothetical protein
MYLERKAAYIILCQQIILPGTSMLLWKSGLVKRHQEAAMTENTLEALSSLERDAMTFASY